MRIILYTGKGGVGKTSVAAATALRAAAMGYKTTVMSTDTAHSLGDSLDMPLSGDATEVASNLWALEIDVYKEMARYWSTISDWLVALMRWQGMDDVVAEETAVLPGMEELVGLLYIVKYAEEEERDLLVVDCAPTGETLRLLSFPETMRWYMQRLFPLERRIASAVGPLARSVLSIPVPEAKVFDSIHNLYEQLERMRGVLTDGAISSVRLVVNPEKMVVKEAQRTFTYLNLYGYFTDLVVCNRVIPKEVEDTFFDAWKESQRRHLQLIEESFSPVPILTAPLMNREVVGLEALQEMGEAIFGEGDPAQIFYSGKAQEIRKEGSYHVLEVTLPFVEKEDISLIQSGEELVAQVGPYRRNIHLPRILVGQPVQQAKLNGKVLKLWFGNHGSKGEGAHSRR